MLPFEEYDDLDALDLGALVRDRLVSRAEVIEAAIARAEARDGRLGAFAHRAFSQALDAARAADRHAGRHPEISAPPMAGVPLPAKDLIHPVAGMPMRSGSAALRDYVPDQEAILFERYRRAGLVILGKTAVPELGLVAVTEPEAYGPTCNPWDIGRTPGGSSGGSAAAVAARIAPVATASDGGGSIRIPASYCGLFGLKPSRGRVTDAPTDSLPWNGAAVGHALTRTVRDSAALLDAVTGPAPGDPVYLPPPERPFLDETARDPEPLRIGFTTRSPLGLSVHPDCQAGVSVAAQLLEELGHHVEEAEPPIEGRAIARAYLMMYFGQTAAIVRLIEERAGRDVKAELEPVTRLLAQIGERVSAGQYVHLQRTWHDAAQVMARYHQTYDLFLTPTVAALPPEIGALTPSATERRLMEMATTLGAAPVLLKTGFVDRLVDERLSLTPFTQLANLTGQPAMSVPLHVSATGRLPIGVQFVAPLAEEARLFRLAGQLERTEPWADRRPAWVAESSSRQSTAAES